MQKHPDNHDFRPLIRTFLAQLLTAPKADLAALMQQFVHADAVWDVSHPLNSLVGHEAILQQLILPLRRAFPHVQRRDLLFIGGQNRRAEHGQWAAAVTHYVGNFQHDWLGIQASTHLVFLRSGEFYHWENGKIKQARLIIDFIDLMRQAKVSPIPHALGTEITFPTPATQDGLIPHDQGSGEVSLDIVEGMLADLHQFDPKQFSSAGQTGKQGYWAEDMLWYGPAGIGSNYRWEGFVQDHRRSFLSAFPDRKGGNHYCRIGDGHYAAVSGWPSMTMTHQGDYLGIKATGKALTLRVMDFYRCAEGQIKENWVLLDYGDLLAQLGRDPFVKG